MWIILIKGPNGIKVIGPFSNTTEAAKFAGQHYSGRKEVSASIVKLIDPESINPDRPLS